ncbi:MAG: ATP-binding protein, partial [Betaproteobacteria bacterium]
AAADAPQGTGLGLAIVRSVAERHGATVALGDSPQGGLRVTVRLPVVAAGAVPPQPRERSARLAQ